MLFISILSLITAKAVNKINISHIHFTRIVFIILLYAGALSFNVLYIQSIGSGIGLYNGYFHINQISQILEIFIFVIGGIILLGWPTITKTNLVLIKSFNYGTDYSLIVLFSILGSSLLISILDLISFYLSLELQSFGLYILATLYREKESSTNAGLKYFLLGGLSSCIILLGAGIIYSLTGLTQLESIYMLIISTNIEYVIIGSLFGVILIMIGLLFKISAAPLHNWSPDVYDETPTIVTIWLTIIPKIALLILILEIYTQLNIFPQFTILQYFNYPLGLLESNSSLFNVANLTGNTIWQENINTNLLSLKNLFLISSVLSLIIGTVVGLAQIKIKRLLAYSTISHIGFMLLALAINTEQSIDSFLFYLIQYIITNLNIFFILLAISYIWSLNSTPVTRSTINNRLNPLSLNIIDVKYIRDLQGLFYTNPFLSLSLSLSLFSMAGIPPFVGFFSKQFVLYSALDSGYYFISLLGILVSVISASYYLKIIKILHIAPTTSSSAIAQSATVATAVTHLVSYDTRQESASTTNNTVAVLSQFHCLIISILSLFILLFILKPTLILNSTQVLSITLFKL